MYVRPATTQVSLCIDPLYKASFLDRPESEEGAYCTISEGSDKNVTLVIPVWTVRLSKLNTINECSDQNMQLRRLTRVFARRTWRFVKPIDCRRYIQLAKALIRLLMCRLAGSECAGWFVSSYKFYCSFCHAQTHARFVCADHNA